MKFKTASSVKTYTILTLFFIITDLAFLILGEQNIHVLHITIAIYLIQMVFTAISAIAFLFRFSITYPFQAGMVSIMFKEFSIETITIIFYAVVSAGYRVWSIMESLNCGGTCVLDFSTEAKVFRSLYRTSIFLINSFYTILFLFAKRCSSTM
jgi:hypothetical protein